MEEHKSVISTSLKSTKVKLNKGGYDFLVMQADSWPIIRIEERDPSAHKPDKTITLDELLRIREYLRANSISFEEYIKRLQGK